MLSSSMKCSTKSTLKNFANITVKLLRSSLLFNKVSGLRSPTLF